MQLRNVNVGVLIIGTMTSPVHHQTISALLTEYMSIITKLHVSHAEKYLPSKSLVSVTHLRHSFPCKAG